MLNILKDLSHRVWPLLGAFLYGFPSGRIKVIGVTGTNGKTTTVHLVSHILEEAGYKVASISSLRFKIGEKEWENTLKMTMPGRMKIQRFLRRAADAGCDYAVMEVTSEGIAQHRHKFINFDTIIFTNLTPEHIESHGSFEKYKQAKGKLFAVPHRVSVVNADDESADYFLSFPAEEKITYRARSKKDEVRITKYEVRGTEDFRVYNKLAASAACRAQGVSDSQIQSALGSFPGVPGRMEIVIKEPFTVIVDYAHTPDSLKKVYTFLRGNSKFEIRNPKLICALGAAGGGRDKWKRPDLGKIAARYCDKVILTNEDPYSENPDKILEEIEQGITKYELRSTNYAKILDRREAIHKALEIANEGDVVVITGKGAELWLMTKDGKIPWDDRRVVREEFAKIR